MTKTVGSAEGVGAWTIGRGFALLQQILEGNHGCRLVVEKSLAALAGDRHIHIPNLDLLGLLNRGEVRRTPPGRLDPGEVEPARGARVDALVAERHNLVHADLGVALGGKLGKGRRRDDGVIEERALAIFARAWVGWIFVARFPRKTVVRAAEKYSVEKNSAAHTGVGLRALGA